MSAVFIKGIYCGSDVKEFTRQSDGKHITAHYMLLTHGADFYKVRSEVDHSGAFQFGDEVTVPVVPNVYKDNIYWNYDE